MTSTRLFFNDGTYLDGDMNMSLEQAESNVGTGLLVYRYTFQARAGIVPDRVMRVEEANPLRVEQVVDDYDPEDEWDGEA